MIEKTEEPEACYPAMPKMALRENIASHDFSTIFAVISIE